MRARGNEEPNKHQRTQYVSHHLVIFLPFAEKPGLARMPVPRTVKPEFNKEADSRAHVKFGLMGSRRTAGLAIICALSSLALQTSAAAPAHLFSTQGRSTGRPLQRQAERAKCSLLDCLLIRESIVMPAAGLKNCRVSRLSPNNPY